MKKFARATVAAVTVLGLGIPGIVGASANVNSSGPSSTTTVRETVHHDTDIDNHNNLGVSATTSQSANTGSANSSGNTTAGGATSGSASNAKSVAATVAVDNSSSMGVMPADDGMGVNNVTSSGPNSTTTVTSHHSVDTDIDNHNTINVSTSTSQNASSGSANVSGNTTGESATSGNASNSSSDTFVLTVTN